MITRRYFLSALPVLLLPLYSRAEQGQTLRVVYHPNIPPYSYQDPQHSTKVIGILIDLINELQAVSNVSFSHHPYPWKRAQILVETGKADAFCCPVTKDRERYAIFTKTPITNLFEPAIFYHPDSPHAAKIKTAQKIEDFYSFKTATFLGNSSHSQTWKNHPDVMLVPNVEQILKMIERGRIDFYFADPIVTGHLIKQIGLSGKLVSFPMGSIVGRKKIPMRFGLRRSYPNAEKIIDRIDALIIKALPPDRHDIVVNRYL